MQKQNAILKYKLRKIKNNSENKLKSEEEKELEFQRSVIVEEMYEQKK